MAEKGFLCVLTLGVETIGRARSVDPTLEADEQDITTRDDAPWDNWQQGRKRLTADIEALWVPTNAGLSAIEDAWFNDSDLAFSIVDSNGWGWSGTCGVLNLKPGPQDMDNAVMLSTSIKSRGTVAQVTGSS